MKWILVLAAFGFTQAFAKINSISDFKRAAIAVKKNHAVLELDNQQPSEPIRLGKVKLTVSKGTYQTEGDNKWDFSWSSVCSKETTFPVKSDNGWDKNNVETCKSTFDGKEVDLYFHVFAFEGEIEINPTEPRRHAIMYALPVYTTTTGLVNFPEMKTPIVALEERANKSIYLGNEPDRIIICSIEESPGEIVPQPEPHPNAHKKSFKPNNCIPNWKEIFKVTAEILD